MKSFNKTKKKIALIFILGFIFSLTSLKINVLPTSGAFDLAAGDTIIYTVTQWQFPIDKVTNVTGGVDLDLTGSSIYVKIMRVSPSEGWYTASAGVILGKTARFNLTALSEGELPTSQYGLNLEDVQVPEGFGFRMGGEEKFWISFDNDRPVLLYLDPDKWSDHKAALESENATVQETNDEFKATVTEEGLTYELIWDKTTNPGLLKSFSVTGQMNFDDGTSASVNIKIEFQSKENKPLPNKNLVELELKKDSSFTYSVTGDLQNQINTSDLQNISDSIDAWKQKTITKYQISDIDGVFYKTSIYGPVDINDPSKGLDERSVATYDGFTADVASYNSFSDSYYSGATPFVGSTAAPLVTPDWDLWKASAIFSKAIVDTIETFVTSNDFKTTVLDGPGITLNTFSLEVDYQESGDFRHMVAEAHLKVTVDGQKFFENMTEGTQQGQGTLTIQLDAKIWTTYYKDGVLAAMGFDVSFDMNGNNFGMVTGGGGQGGGSQPETINGELKIDSKIILNNKEYNPPEPAAAGQGGSVLPTPGFEALPLLIVIPIISMVAIVRKRRHA